MLNNDSVQPQSDSAHSADDHAVGDALECLLHIVQSSSQGHTVALQSGGLFAVAQALQVSLSSFCFALSTHLHLVECNAKSPRSTLI